MANQSPPPAKNLSSQRSTCFLLEPQHVQGLDFVEMLRLIGYPDAQNLKGEDFDWLCKGSEEVQLFLGWLCEVVDQRNTVTDKDLEAYKALVDSGQPILDTEELQSIYKSSEKLEVELEVRNLRSSEELEAEVQHLRALKTHRLHVRNKMESLGMKLFHKHLTLEQSEKELERTLNNTKDNISTLNSRFNLAQQELRNSVLSLGQHYVNQATNNVCISSLNLEEFIKLEDKCWEQAEQYAKELLHTKDDLETQQEMEKESERLRSSWASHRIQLSISLGFLNSNMAALDWLEGNSVDKVWDPLRLPLLEREAQSLELEIENLQTESLPTLVYDASLGFCTPAQFAWVRAEQSRISQVTKGQALAADAILDKLSRLQLLELGLQLEKRYHQQNEQDLRDLKMELAEQSSERDKRMLVQTDLRVSPQWLTPLRVDSRDHTAVRLYAMLEKPTRHKELFPKYEALQCQAAALVQELESVRDVFHDPLPETSNLENDTEELHQGMCLETRNLQLREMELVLTSETLLSNFFQFNHWFLDFFRELERKKLAIQSPYTAQERQLYVHFYQNPALLARIVEDLEQQVKDLDLNQS